MMTAVLIYGSNFVISRHATLNGLTPNDLTALRFGIAGLVLLPVFWRAGLRDCAGLGWRRGLLLAVMSGVPMTLLMNTGLSLAPAAHGAAIQPGIVTVMGVAGSMIMFRARPSRPALIGIGIVLSGLAAIGLAASTSGTRSVMLGDACFFAAGALWGAYPLLLQRWRVPAMTGTVVVAVLSCAYLPLYLARDLGHLAVVPPLALILHAFYQGILNAILGLWLWGSAVRAIGAAKAQRFPPLIPVVGTLLAVPVLGEWPGALQTIGVTLIVGGIGFAALGDRLVRRSIDRSDLTPS
jgi:drug/metabolite transporter (DMT)-like permease